MSRFSNIVMEHFLSPRNRGRMADADAVGVDGVPGRGRYFIIYLRINDDRIGEALFECNGCGVTIAVGSALTEMITNRLLQDCGNMDVESLLSELGGLPSDKRYCAEFAIRSLKDAVRQRLTF